MEKINQHILRLITFPDIRAVGEMVWKVMAETDTLLVAV
jgi:hypothetical protein